MRKISDEEFKAMWDNAYSEQVKPRKSQRRIPFASQMVMNVIATQLFRQNEKGLNKYGNSIDDAHLDIDGVEYDWNQMALEETIDGMHYLVKENMRLKRIINELREGI